MLKFNLEFAKEFFLGIQSFVNKTGNDTLVEVNIAIYLIDLKKKQGLQIDLDFQIQSLEKNFIMIQQSRENQIQL